MTPRRIVIGDVHGHYKGLMTLLEAIAPDSEERIYFLGDLIDRGPQSAQVVKFVQESSYNCLLGNHEQMLLDSFIKGKIQHAVLQAWLYSGGHATLASYPKGRIPVHDLDWMQTLPTHLDLGDIWLVHAGVHPEIPLEEQTADQFCWIRHEFHSMSQPYFANKLIITGHTITFTLPGVEPGKIAAGSGWLDIDTGAYHRRSGWLTGLDISNAIVYQVNVFDNYVRTLPLEKTLTPVQPDQIVARKQNGVMANW
ncbi:metallophosphoesterase family protein [Microseira sp. BLCC-F43]|uniref:metallophosphoesterase family protein n=1 Tax=Microseira sp. BLCC-F43 TaxID=3153602 RepID=UPI0035B76980